MRTVTLQIPEVTLASAERLAQRQDVSVGQIFRNALSNEIRLATRNAKTPNRADEQLLAPLRALLAADFGQAQSWTDLNGRLDHKGYHLREAGGGLALHCSSTGNRLCKASELGHGYASLMRRFGQPFPGHAHTWLAHRVLGQDSVEDEIELIEPF